MKLRQSLASLSLTAFVILFAAGCAHKGIEKDLDSKVEEHPALRNSGDLNATAQEHIENAPGLNPEQRTELTTLREKTHHEMEDLDQQILKLKSMAVRNAIQTDSNHHELNAIKKRIRKLEERRLNLFFQTIDRSLTIIDRGALSRTSIHRDWIFRDLLLERQSPSFLQRDKHAD